MQTLGDPLYHLRLLGRMGHTVGADLVQAFEAGKIDNETWTQMITNCRGCPYPQKCHAWLDATEQAAAPPSGCCNAESLHQLRDAAKKDLGK